MRLTSTFLLFACLLFTARAEAFVAVAPTPPATDVEATKAEALAAVEAYRAELEAMTGKERRKLRREQRREVRDAIKAHRNSDAVDEGSALLIILAILLPPLAVFLYEDQINNKFWISLILTLLFFLPGIIYALLVITGNV